MKNYRLLTVLSLSFFLFLPSLSFGENSDSGNEKQKEFEVLVYHTGAYDSYDVVAIDLVRFLNEVYIPKHFPTAPLRPKFILPNKDGSPSSANHGSYFLDAGERIASYYVKDRFKKMYDQHSHMIFSAVYLRFAKHKCNGVSIAYQFTKAAEILREIGVTIKENRMLEVFYKSQSEMGSICEAKNLESDGAKIFIEGLIASEKERIKGPKPDFSSDERKIKDSLGTDSVSMLGSRDRGSIVIKYNSNEERKKIVEKFESIKESCFVSMRRKLSGFVTKR